MRNFYDIIQLVVHGECRKSNARYFSILRNCHFHAKYEGQVAVFEIKTHHLIAGDLPPHAKKMVRQWMSLHEKELLNNWQKAQKNGNLKTIEPLL